MGPETFRKQRLSVVLLFCFVLLIALFYFILFFSCFIDSSIQNHTYTVIYIVNISMVYLKSRNGLGIISISVIYSIWIQAIPSQTVFLWKQSSSKVTAWLSRSQLILLNKFRATLLWLVNNEKIIKILRVSCK